MSVFSEAALAILSQYRSLLRKTTSSRQEREEKLIVLQLDYQYSKDNDYQLYQKLSNVLNDLNNHQHKDANGYYHYSGIKKFSNHLTNFMTQYHIDDKSVVHCTQLASKYMVEVIQLASVSNPDTLCSADSIKRLATANRHIASYGVSEQHKQHLENLKKYRDENPAFFDGMISNFNKAISDTPKEKATE